jgi:hypothetical protein
MCGLVESGGKSVVFVTCYTQYQFLVVGETIGLTLNLSDPKPKVGRAVARSSAPSEAAEIAKLTKAAREEAIRESVPEALQPAMRSLVGSSWAPHPLFRLHGWARADVDELIGRIAAMATEEARAEAIRESVPKDLRSANYFERHPSRTGKGKQQFAA